MRFGGAIGSVHNRDSFMKDGPALAFVKAVIRWSWRVELGLRRGLGGAWRRRFWRLAGECNACGACCVEPSIRAGALVWHLPLARRLFLAWQRFGNGFELVRAEAGTHDLIFRCTHYDPVSHRCDSYATRPSMCRDYPTLLLGQGWPELFDGCSHRIVARRPQGLAAGIAATALSAEAKAELRRKLRLE
jgi:Fe-S-cluster containining protein